MGHDFFSKLDSAFPSFASNISVVLASLTLNFEYVVAETIILSQNVPFILSQILVRPAHLYLFKTSITNLVIIIIINIVTGASVASGGANVSGATVGGAIVGGANVTGAIIAFCGAIVGGAIVGGANVGGAIVGGANVGGATVVRGAFVTGAIVAFCGAIVGGANCRRSKWEQLSAE